MANAHIPKHNFSSLSRDGGELPQHSCQLGDLSRCIAKRLNVYKFTEYNGLAAFRINLSRLFLSVILLVGVVPVSTMAAPTYRFSGIIQGVGRFAVPSNSVARFTVTVSDCSWRIDIDQKTLFQNYDGRFNYNSKNNLEQSNSVVGNVPILVRQLISSGAEDGTIYTITDQKIEGQTNTVPIGSVKLGPEPVYITGFPFIQILWSAFCSGCFFESANTNIIPMLPPFANRTDRQPFDVRLTLLNERNHKLPKKMVFIDPGFTVVGRQNYPRPVPFNKGFNASSYLVERVINTNSINLPMEFNLKVFRPIRGATNVEALEIEFEYDCVVTNLSFGELVSQFRPEIPKGSGLIRTFDSRYTKQAYQYMAEKWLPPEEVTNSSGFKSWARAHQGPMPAFVPKAKISNPKARTWVVTSLVIVSFCLLIFLIATKRGFKSVS